MGTRSAGYHVKLRPDRDDPVRYVALKAMIAWWRQGLGFGAIATRLNKLGVPSPDAGYTRTEKGAAHALSGQWQVNTVKNILLNPLINIALRNFVASKAKLLYHILHHTN